MKHYPPPAPPQPRAPRLAIPPFHAVPGRARADGWTPERQARFIGHLAETRSVTKAARRVEMARESAYRLRRRRWAEGFCAAWDAAMGLKAHGGETIAGKVTSEELRWRIESGLWQVILKDRRFAGAWRQADNSALLQLMARQRFTRQSPLRMAPLP